MNVTHSLMERLAGHALAVAVARKLATIEPSLALVMAVAALMLATALASVPWPPATLLAVLVWVVVVAAAVARLLAPVLLATLAARDGEG